MSGRLVWRTPVVRDACRDKTQYHCLNGIVSPPVVTGEAVIVGAMDGVLRAYDRRDGRVFWSYDAMRPFQAVNGRTGHGGGFGMGGVVISGNRMFVTSGINSGAVGSSAAPGVLLAFDIPSSRAENRSGGSNAK